MWAKMQKVMEKLLIKCANNINTFSFAINTEIIWFV